ncbi:hypothetical protein C0Z18_15735 [Trinickia dabaoshanensis]|uniref:Uncharacterized protein n=1 Tax=Trinickia dabaoshanensis TaxID=564714 RepID=A0A2N7VNS8_9BURK|nr:hypothetical protein [Trinickia dabaoshanensis]PMS18786.1 hypothetical protein C0Z18_15735 [Trinickia dabaoshanensis]
MSEEEDALWQMTQYEGFEVHVAPLTREPGENTPLPAGQTFTYIGYVCHPGADPKLPGHAVPFHADGDVGFASPADALDEGMHVGRTIVDGTHPDLTVLPLVTGGV